MEQTIRLTSDHGKFCTAEDGGGNEGQVIDNRQAGLMTANRTIAGAWEEFTVVESDQIGVFGLRSRHGKFACCENAEEDSKLGRAGIIVFNRDSIGPWEKFIIHNVEDGRKVAFESVARPKYFIKAWPDGSVTLDQSMNGDTPVDEPGAYETYVSDPPLRTVGVQPKNFITGQLRISGSGYADDKGPYLPVGIHMGDLFSCYCYGQMDKVQDALSKIRDAGYGLVQFWLNLGSLGGDYWLGREIGPEITPDYWGKVVRFSDLLDSYGLKGIFCTGDYALRGMSHNDFATELGRILSGRNTGALVIAGNEAWQTGAESIDTLNDFCDAFKRVCPSVCITTTAPPTEAKDDIANWCDGDFYAIHGYRGGEDHDRVRHIFSVPWEGDPPTEYGFQDEPTGPGDEVSVKASHCYHGRDVDASHLFALAVQSLMCNQGYNFFCGDGVKLTGDIARWQGFYEVAVAPNALPKDIMSWDKPFHFGESQSSHRVFGPDYGNQVRFDCRLSPSGQIFGVLYGDEGEFGIRCYRRCRVKVSDYKGNVYSEQEYAPGSKLFGTFVRSQNGQPGLTSFIVTGQLL